VDALAGALDHVLSDLAAASEMGRNARRLVESTYTWPRVAQRCEQVYANIRRTRAGNSSAAIA
jgi:glycosyltransferase involved in cell wall biosynthesis